ncbi:MAG: B12-binding domain-containing radical SAM protein [Methanobrevibacter sp.]|jgi:radical SAM superfamily enzyme YgiQ (UPF0313 family)|nr:B12-binding domain-containing radical SAM protein [Methanobrevibacter sp.]
MKTIIIKPNRFSFYTASRVYHGIGYIIQYAKLNGETIDYLDLYRMNWKEFKNRIKDYDLVGYSILSFDYTDAMKAISLNKEVNKNATIVVGGVDVSIDPDKYIQNPLIDHVIKGEGEISFFNLIQQRKMGKINEKLIIGEPIEDLDSLGFIDRDLFPKEKITADVKDLLGYDEHHFSIFASRVCPYNCKFCISKTIFGSKPRFRSAEHVVKELIYLKNKYGLKSFNIFEDNTLQNREWLLKFIDCCKKTNFKAKFNIVGRVDSILKNKDLLKELYEIGLRFIFIGIESGSDKMLKYFNKGTTVDLNRKALSTLHENGIYSFSSFMFGFPAETKKDIKLTEKFIRENKISFFLLNQFFPYPGSYLYEEYKNNNLIYEGTNIAVYNLHMAAIFGFLHLPLLKGVNYYYVSWTMFKIYFYQHSNLKSRLFNILSLFMSYVGISIFYLIHNLGKAIKKF